MLTTLRTILTKADQGGYAVIAPDFPSLFIARILIEQAQAKNTPLILSYSTVFKPMRDVLRYDRFIRIVREEVEHASIPIALHLDHATELDDIAEAVDLGFTSVMMDASFEPFEVNIERTRKAVGLARPAGVSVEAELGHVATGSNYINVDQHQGLLTNPGQAEEFVQATGIDALAVAIGTVHGTYQTTPKLDFELLQELDRRIQIPLVLHGSSGLRAEDIRRTISLGIRKVNVYSDIIYSVLDGAYQELKQQRSNPNKVAQAQAARLITTINAYLDLSGSSAINGQDQK